MVQVRLPSSLSSEVLQCARYPTEGRWKIKTELLLPRLLVMYSERYYVGLYSKGKDLSNSCPDSSLGMSRFGSTWEDAHSLEVKCSVGGGLELPLLENHSAMCIS